MSTRNFRGSLNLLGAGVGLIVVACLAAFFNRRLEQQAPGRSKPEALCHGNEVTDGHVEHSFPSTSSAASLVQPPSNISPGPRLVFLEICPRSTGISGRFRVSSAPRGGRVNKLAAGALRGPGKLALLPLARVKKDESEALIFIHLGRGLCGHDGIIHGGLLATLLDETIVRNAILNLPHKVGVTATLSLTYSIIRILKTQPVEAKGRKAIVSGRVKALDGTLLIEAEYGYLPTAALLIEPRYAKLLSPITVQQQIVEQPKNPVVTTGGVQPLTNIPI
ncbi:HotDog domain-containing protein [Mycena vulgaris]|nr:HotDog domain-containing protein [Mycena vulgaris]